MKFKTIKKILHHCILFFLVFLLGGCYKNFRDYKYYDDTDFQLFPKLSFEGVEYEYSKKDLIIFQLKVVSVGKIEFWTGSKKKETIFLLPQNELILGKVVQLSNQQVITEDTNLNTNLYKILKTNGFVKVVKVKNDLIVLEVKIKYTASNGKSNEIEGKYSFERGQIYKVSASEYAKNFRLGQEALLVLENSKTALRPLALKRSKPRDESAGDIFLLLKENGAYEVVDSKNITNPNPAQNK